MPPSEAMQPSESVRLAFSSSLDRELINFEQNVRAASGRIRLRRMTRSEFEATLKDLLALERLEIKEMLPADGRVAGYDKIASGLDISPGHSGGYRRR